MKDGEQWFLCEDVGIDLTRQRLGGAPEFGVDAAAAGVVEEDAGKPRALAFRVPHTNDRGTEPRNYLTSIDDIEQATRLDFFAPLPDDIENQLEAARPSSLWAVPGNN